MVQLVVSSHRIASPPDLFPRPRNLVRPCPDMGSAGLGSPAEAGSPFFVAHPIKTPHILSVLRSNFLSPSPEKLARQSQSRSSRTKVAKTSKKTKARPPANPRAPSRILRCNSTLYASNGCISTPFPVQVWYLSPSLLAPTDIRPTFSLPVPTKLAAAVVVSPSRHVFGLV